MLSLVTRSVTVVRALGGDYGRAAAVTSNPHDALFKAVFGEPDNARGALRAVVPPALAAAVDWSTLAREPGSFVDDELRECHTDLLFSAQLRDGGGALVYVLFEHQSTPDPLMAYRLLRYAVRIWDQVVAQPERAMIFPRCRTKRCAAAPPPQPLLPRSRASSTRGMTPIS